MYRADCTLYAVPLHNRLYTVRSTITQQTVHCTQYHYTTDCTLYAVPLHNRLYTVRSTITQGVPGRLSPWIFLTFRHYKGGRSSAIRTGRLYPRKNSWYSLSEAESTSGHMVLSGVPRKKSPVTPPGIDPGTVRLVAQLLNHYATPVLT